jgi:hypothetical protein
MAIAQIVADHFVRYENKGASAKRKKARKAK